MRLSRRATAIGAALVVAAVVAGIGGVAVANDGDDQELVGDTRERAIAAALAHTGGEGTVTETEIGGDGARYEVEIRMDDGSQIEVQLNADFEVTGSENDDDGPGGEDDDD